MKASPNHAAARVAVAQQRIADGEIDEEDEKQQEEKPLVAKAKKVLGDNVNIDWEDVLYDDDDDDEDEGVHEKDEL